MCTVLTICLPATVGLIHFTGFPTVGPAILAGIRAKVVIWNVKKIKTTLADAQKLYAGLLFTYHPPACPWTAEPQYRSGRTSNRLIPSLKRRNSSFYFPSRLQPHLAGPDLTSSRRDFRGSRLRWTWRWPESQDYSVSFSKNSLTFCKNYWSFSRNSLNLSKNVR